MDPYRLVRPLLFRLPPERAHQLTIAVLATLPLPTARPDPPILASLIAGLALPNPIGLAAGFDKDARAIDGARAIGFGFVEVGTLTPLPQPGNPRPRVFRLTDDRALINRLGFNNGGQAAALPRLARALACGGVVGVNVGANKDTADRVADYVAGVRRMAPVADYLTVNISSPNTPGLRDLQGEAELRRLLAAVAGARPDSADNPVPIFIKLAPDLADAALPAIVDLALEYGVDGLIATNTTLARPAVASRHAHEPGGLSGTPLFARSTDVLRQLRRLAGGRLALIGVGGVASGADAYAKIRAGADAVQLYTGLVYHGPGLVRRIKRELAALLARDGFASVADAVGADA